MYFIYKIYSNDDLIYIGKTNNIYSRIKNHLSQQPWKKEITRLEIADCKTKIDMDIYEKYYINKLKTKYNLSIVYDDSPTFKIGELVFKKFELKEFIEINKPNHEVKNTKINRYEKMKNEINERIENSTEIKKGKK